jgi:hypothetical protein
MRRVVEGDRAALECEIKSSASLAPTFRARRSRCEIDGLNYAPGEVGWEDPIREELLSLSGRLGRTTGFDFRFVRLVRGRTSTEG